MNGRAAPASDSPATRYVRQSQKENINISQGIEASNEVIQLARPPVIRPAKKTGQLFAPKSNETKSNENQSGKEARNPQFQTKTKSTPNLVLSKAKTYIKIRNSKYQNLKTKPESKPKPLNPPNLPDHTYQKQPVQSGVDHERTGSGTTTKKGLAKKAGGGQPESAPKAENIVSQATSGHAKPSQAKPKPDHGRGSQVWPRNGNSKQAKSSPSREKPSRASWQDVHSKWCMLLEDDSCR